MRAKGRQVKRFRLAEQEKTMNKGTRGAILASAVAALFLASAAMAQDSGSATSSGSAAQAASTKCVGGNSCKGQGSCKSTQNDCKGQNGCKGKGFVMTSSVKDCTTAGGKVEK
jgi:exo-beta-1,3-glucanase (GH17 family)